MKWDDRGNAFVINDAEKLIQLLPQYFGTDKLKSFMRQLYLYKFRRTLQGTIKEYWAPNFTRGKFHETLKAKKKKLASKSEEVAELKEAHDLLAIKYETMWESVLELHRQVSETVRRNKEHLESILDFKFYFVEKIKATNMMLAINSTFYQPQTYQDINAVTKSQKYIQAGNLEPFVDNYSHFDKSPETLKLHIHATLLSPINYNSYIGRLVRVSFNRFNRKYFNLSSKKFYSKVLKYFFRDEVDSELSEHPNYHLLERAKYHYELIFNGVVADYVSKDMAEIFRAMHKTHRIEILPLGEDYPEHSTDSHFSLRTLSSQLGIKEFDLFLFQKPDLDD